MNDLATRSLPTGPLEGCSSARDRALVLVPFYAGLRIGEAVPLDVDDVRQSARRALLVVHSGRRGRYREVRLHRYLRTAVNVWLEEW